MQSTKATRMSSKLNIGVVGIGRMGQRHALNLLHRVPRAHLLCVCSPAPHEIEWVNQHLKPEGVQVFASFDEMICTPGLQAVVIASSTNLHVLHTLAAMERGIHVLCEKPVTTDVAEVCSLPVCRDYGKATKAINSRSWNRLSRQPGRTRPSG